MPRTTGVSVALIAIAVAACREAIEMNADVSIAPESRVEKVVFVIESSKLFYGFAVIPCQSERPVWSFGREGGNIPPASRIVYSETPPGYTERNHAQPLQPGCYRAIASGSKNLRFVVNTDGTITIPSPNGDSSAVP